MGVVAQGQGIRDGRDSERAVEDIGRDGLPLGPESLGQFADLALDDPVEIVSAELLGNFDAEGIFNFLDGFPVALLALVIGNLAVKDLDRA